MICRDTDSCFAEIDAYCKGEKTGHALLVNVQNDDDYLRVLNRLQADRSKQCIFVSEHCAENGLPNLDDICLLITGDGCTVLIGVSQAAMLRSGEFLRDTVGKLLELPVRGHAVVLLTHAASPLGDFMAKNQKNAPKVVLVQGEESPLPRIRLARTAEDCAGLPAISGMKRLFGCLEQFGYAHSPEPTEITAVVPFSPALFSNAVYSVTPCDSVYRLLCRKHPDIASGTRETYAQDDRWRRLADLLEKRGSLSSVAENEFGAGSDYAPVIGKIWHSGDAFRMWLLWLCMKVLGTSGNRYLAFVIDLSETVSDFEEKLYMALLQINTDDPQFGRYYSERKELLRGMPENPVRTDAYCASVGRREKQAVYYLTDFSDREKRELLHCLSMYAYSEDELNRITERNFRSLFLYLQPFRFNAANMTLPAKDEALRDELTDYFQQYKMQKVTNRIRPDFLQRVEKYAQTRPYNKLQPRSAIVGMLPFSVKQNAQLFFFDALGVEYLAYIAEKCREYHLIAQISVGRAALPSITENNREFLSAFQREAKKIDALDELKHHSLVMDYTKCREPVHLFSELAVIDEQLKAIRSHLIHGNFEQAVVIADHGASRLAVIREEENPSSLVLDEKAEHSGRCCRVPEDPHIPNAEYENGFSVLADYSRFKGGRRANVEVHGGASLEEVLIVVIVLSRQPENAEICFVNPLIELRGKAIAAITVFSSTAMKQPRLLVDGKFYEGSFVGDEKHAKFELPELKRSRDCVADVYDGNACLARNLSFRVQKSVAKDILHF